MLMYAYMGLPGTSAGKESACNAEDSRSVPGSGRSPGEGIGYPLQYSWASLVVQLVKNLPAMWETWVRSLGWKIPWKIPMDRGAWQTYRSWGHKELDTTERLSRHVRVKEVKVKVAQSCLTLCDPMGCSPGQNTGVGSLSLLQGVFPTQGLNPGLPHCRRILYQLSQKGIPHTHVHISALFLH